MPKRELSGARHAALIVFRKVESVSCYAVSAAEQGVAVAAPSRQPQGASRTMRTPSGASNRNELRSLHSTLQRRDLYRPYRLEIWPAWIRLILLVRRMTERIVAGPAPLVIPALETRQ